MLHGDESYRFIAMLFRFVKLKERNWQDFVRKQCVASYPHKEHQGNKKVQTLYLCA